MKVKRKIVYQIDQSGKLEDISAFLWPIKKTGYSAINRTEGNLTQEWLPGGRKPSQSSIFRKYHKRTKKSIRKT